jgi:HEAT repeat protein
MRLHHNSTAQKVVSLLVLLSIVLLDISACTSGQTPTSPQAQTLPAAEGTAQIPAEETQPETPKAKETPPTATPVPPTATPTVSPLITLVPALGDADRDVRVSAVESLGELGAAAKEAVPDLVKVLLQDKDWFVRFAAAEALGKIQAEAAPALSQVLEDGSGNAAFLALMALREIGPEAGEAIPSLIGLLEGADPLLRTKAAETFAFIEPVSEDTVSLLIQKLGDADDDGQQAITRALGAIGSEAVPQLIEALGDEDPNMQERAAGALGQMGAEAKEAVPALIEALSQEWAIRTLGEIGPEAKEAVPVLIQAAEESVGIGASSGALTALGRIGTEEAVAFLNEKIVQPVGTYDFQAGLERQAAAMSLPNGSLTDEATGRLIAALAGANMPEWLGLSLALGIQAGRDEQVVSALIDALEDRSRDVRNGAAFALSIGQHEEAVPALLQALHDEAHHVRANAARALGSSGVASEEVVSALIEALGDEEGVARLGAMEGLGKFGPAGKEAVPALIELALHGDKAEDASGGQRDAVEALGGIGPGAVDAVPALTDLLQDQDPAVRELAAQALGEVGPDAEGAIPQLLEMLGDEDNSARTAATVALTNIQPDTEEAIAVLVQVLGDHEQARDQRYSAAVALGRSVAGTDIDARTWLEMWGVEEEE